MSTPGNKYYGILTFVSSGGVGVSYAQMVRRFGEQLTDEVIAIGAVEKRSVSSDKNSICVITNFGRKLREQ